MRELFELVGLSSDDKRISINKDDGISFVSDDIVICDPQYVISDYDWNELSELCETSDASKIGIDFMGTAVIRGSRILYTNISGETENKVFEITDCIGVGCGVVETDSNMICVMAKRDVERLREFRPNMEEHMFVHIENFSGEVRVDGLGNFIGELEINTEG